MDRRFSHEPPVTVVFSRAGVRALDKAAIEELGIPGIILMENAAASLEAAALELLDAGPSAGVVILTGPGNNGGDGCALARRLAIRAVQTTVVLAFDPLRAKGDAATNLNIIQRMGLPIVTLTPGATPAQLDRAAPDLRRAILIDALLGTGADREPLGLVAQCIAWANGARSAGARVLAVDIPSGLDCDTGRPIGSIAMEADLTVTLAGAKRGLLNPEARRWCGRVLVGDIGVPPALLRRFADA